MKLRLAALVLAVLASEAGIAGAKGMTVDDLLAMQRVGAPAVSPDNKWVAFAVRDTDVEANRGRFDLWMVGIDGSNLRRLTSHPDNDTDPAWSADGKWIYFISNRGGASQVWRISPVGGESAGPPASPAIHRGDVNNAIATVMPKNISARPACAVEMAAGRKKSTVRPPRTP